MGRRKQRRSRLSTSLVSHFDRSVQQQNELEDFDETRQKALEEVAASNLENAIKFPFHAFLSNLNFKASRAETVRVLECYGKVLDFKYVGKKKPGYPNCGLGTVQYETASALNRLLTDTARCLCGRTFNAREDSKNRTSMAHNRAAGMNEWTVVSLRFGCWDVDSSSFATLMATTTGICLKLLPVLRSMLLYFSCEHQSKKKLKIRNTISLLSLADPDAPAAYRADIRLGSIVGQVHYSMMGTNMVLTFRLNRPPYVFKNQPTLMQHVNGDDAWERCCNLPDGDQVVELDSCNAIQLTFSNVQTGAVQDLLVKLAHVHLRPSGYRANSPGEPLQSHSISHHPISGARFPWTAEHTALLSFSTRYMLQQVRCARFGSIADPAAELLRTVVQLVQEYSGQQETHRDGYLAVTAMSAVEEAVRAVLPLVLVDTASASNPCIVEAMVQTFQEELLDGSGQPETGADPTSPSESLLDQIWVRRVFITPTRVVCLPAELEAANRAFRIFLAESGLSSRSEAETYFLRVTFTDENFSSVLYRGGPGSFDGVEELYQRMRMVLAGGIDVAGRMFQFLGWSNSMIKEHACWFFATYTNSMASKMPAITAERLRLLLGDFTKIPVVAKCASRIAQCFSATVATTSLVPSWMREIPDVTSSCGRYTFSDGVGTVSIELAREIFKSYCEITLSKKSVKRMQSAMSALPSAFHFRFGGVKGVVSVDARLSGLVVNIRPSMRKFQGQTSTFDVCTVARRLPAYLNRQVITLLTTNGIPDRVFENMQEAMLQQLRTGLHSKATARALFRSCNGGGIEPAELMEILDSPFVLAVEPFLVAIAAAVVKSKLQELRERTRILVEGGANLLGIMDETGVLQYGEVFVAFSEQEEDRAGDFKAGCDVLVTRCPCTHPGDIRVLRTQSLESLVTRAGGRHTAVGQAVHMYFAHLRDVVIFPQKGPRPHPDELAGGDLDGDQYFVFWDQRLLPPPDRRNVPAMNYAASPPKTAATLPVHINDIADFFIDFIRNDNMGMVANAHVVFADKSPQGAACSECLRLAALHSTAVDFQKTGIPAEFPKDLRVTNFPDFMENEIHASYKSEKILGRLYRSVRAVIQEMDQREGAVKTGADTSTTPVVADEDLRVPGMSNFFDIALRHAEDWRHDLLALMTKFGVRREAEVMSGHVDRFRARAFRKKKKFEVQELLRREMRQLKEKYRSAFRETVQSYVEAALYSDETPLSADAGLSGGLADCPAWLQDSASDLLPDQTVSASYANLYVTAAVQLASAWYEVTYNPVGGESHCQILSLPWLVSEFLVHIRACRKM